jgi:hypothetical protein
MESLCFFKIFYSQTERNTTMSSPGDKSRQNSVSAIQVPNLNAPLGPKSPRERSNTVPLQGSETTPIEIVLLGAIESLNLPTPLDPSPYIGILKQHLIYNLGALAMLTNDQLTRLGLPVALEAALTRQLSIFGLATGVSPSISRAKTSRVRAPKSRKDSADRSALLGIGNEQKDLVKAVWKEVAADSNTLSKFFEYVGSLVH